MKELMIHVERIVRPIHADWSKLRIRRELLTHLRAAFDEERARGLDEPAALSEAKRRLGDPVALARELQNSISRVERLSASLAKAPLPGSVAFILVLLAILLPIFLVVAPSTARIAPHGGRAVFVTGIVMMELSAFCWYAFMAGILRPGVRLPRIVGAGIAGVIAQFAWMWLVAFALTGRAAPSGFTDAAFAALLVPAFCLVMGIVAILARRPTKPWLDLNIAN